MSQTVVDNIIRTISIISSKYAPPHAQVYNNAYLIKLVTLPDIGREKTDTVLALARSGVRACCAGLEVDYKKVSPLYTKNLRRLFNELLSSV